MSLQLENSINEENNDSNMNFGNETLKELGLEILEVSTSTMLEDMGASVGKNSCSTVIVGP